MGRLLLLYGVVLAWRKGLGLSRMCCIIPPSDLYHALNAPKGRQLRTMVLSRFIRVVILIRLLPCLSGFYVLNFDRLRAFLQW